MGGGRSGPAEWAGTGRRPAQLTRPGLAAARLDLDLGGQRRVIAADIFDLDAGRVLELLPQRQAFLFVDGRIDGDRAFGFGGGQKFGNDPAGLGGRLWSLRAGRGAAAVLAAGRPPLFALFYEMFRCITTWEGFVLSQDAEGREIPDCGVV